MLIKNKIYETEITSYTSEGSGVGRIEGIAVFVPGAASKDKLRIKIIKTAKSYAIGKIEEILTKSPHRTEPLCPHFQKCGGCTLLHTEYHHQLEIKRQHVKDCLERLGGFSGISVKAVIPSDPAIRYRNKMVFPIGDDKGKIVGGFYAQKSHRIIPTEDCLLGDRLAADALTCVLNYMNENKIKPYCEETHKGSVRRLMVRTAKNTGEAMAVLSVNGNKLPKAEELTKALLNIKNEKYKFASVILNINKEKNNLVLGDKNVTLYGKSTISDTLLGIKFNISPNSFYQVNPAQTEKLYQKAIELAQPSKSETVLDLYCGAGTISLACAGHAKKVIGVEIVPQAIADAKINAENNNIKNAEFILGSADDIAPRLAENGIKPDCIIVDPPRKGLDGGAISAIGKMKPQRVVYVSCNPATLARDLKELTSFGYNIIEVQPADMFPHSGHVESCVLLCREEK